MKAIFITDIHCIHIILFSSKSIVGTKQTPPDGESVDFVQYNNYNIIIIISLVN